MLQGSKFGWLDGTCTRNLTFYEKGALTLSYEPIKQAPAAERPRPS